MKAARLLMTWSQVFLNIALTHILVKKITKVSSDSRGGNYSLPCHVRSSMCGHGDKGSVETISEDYLPQSVLLLPVFMFVHSTCKIDLFLYNISQVVFHYDIGLKCRICHLNDVQGMVRVQFLKCSFSSMIFL